MSTVPLETSDLLGISFPVNPLPPWSAVFVWSKTPTMGRVQAPAPCRLSGDNNLLLLGLRGRERGLKRSGVGEEGKQEAWLGLSPPASSFICLLARLAAPFPSY